MKEIIAVSWMQNFDEFWVEVEEGIMYRVSTSNSLKQGKTNSNLNWLYYELSKYLVES